MRDIFAGKRHRFTGLRIPSHPGRAIMQRETAEPADFDSLSAREAVTHDFEDVFDIAAGAIFVDGVGDMPSVIRMDEIPSS